MAKIVEIIEHKVGVIAALEDDRKAPEEIRERLLENAQVLQGKTGGWFDVREISQTCDQEIEIVQAGLTICRRGFGGDRSSAQPKKSQPRHDSAADHRAENSGNTKYF